MTEIAGFVTYLPASKTIIDKVSASRDQIVGDRGPPVVLEYA